ncbi:MAG: TrbC/VirB2 family protein [bacterium]|nr:TrbC/VirB2 family protein [bacterium]
MNKKILFLVLLAVILIFSNTASVKAASTLSTMVDNIKNMLALTAIPFVIIGWLIAGIIYLTSGGSPEKTGLGKKALIAAVIGTVLVMSTSAAISIYEVIFSALTSGT